MSEEKPPEPQTPLFWRGFKTLHHFWNRSVLLMFTRVYIQLFVVYIALLSIYWGTYYHRDSRLHRLKFLAIVADDSYPNNEGVPVIGETFKSIIFSPTISSQSGWTLVDSQNFTSVLKPHNNNTYLEELTRQVYQQNYWAGCLVAPNASYDYYQAIVNSQPSVELNSSTVVTCIYQTGRDALTVSYYIEPVVAEISSAMINYASPYILGPLVKQIPQSERSQVVSKVLQNNATAPLLISPFAILLTDLRPNRNASVTGIIYIGLIYVIVITVQLFNFSTVIHAKIVDKVESRSYLYYRLGASQVIYVFLSLAYALVGVAFGISYDAAFGKSGFLVIWAASYLNFSALAGVNEVILPNLVAYDRSYVGYYIVGFLIINVCGITSALAVCPKFYRYSYGLPTYNFQKILVVCIFDTTKRDIGRCFGILVAWAVVTHLVVPFSSKLAIRNTEKLAKMRQ
ncbi:hypothetical protein DASC09_014750 [Saccharomycopsis crataegensis]|uniref:DUF3533 domain-containing protein n=1 Tax=Saccharomycopsis crataegensis TaxID=43959 RepID=A0AAV5QGU0_9ASCO|nr:hypothetical protein DASC09_014750 [Saccharomycopsis crataegensis]